ncbi:MULTISPECIES: hypothetical protein [Lactobacillaceae]|uniref:DUF6994 family protein n=1 Tax=Lactobacillaceae TaxID=33958 RepID=UPI00145730F3|nr:hypothetical protein [Lactobacillus sp. HBUAS51381]NLR09829.1 hypothetical protein [Lactobacillus sp. HBUAS51381]
MDLVHYAYGKAIRLADFLKMDELQAIRFDFLTQGGESDRCPLINEIYQQIFPWYDKKADAGDTLNTYRLAIQQYYGHYYWNLDRASQIEIIGIIRQYAPHNESQIFEYEQIDQYGKPYYQVCNNYQLGNFGILPVHGGINPKRSGSPYFDFFDCYLEKVATFYAGKLGDDRLSVAIRKQSAYFEQFGSFDQFVEKNILMDFFEGHGDGQDRLYDQPVRLSGLQSFKDYVRASSRIITRRSQRIWHELRLEHSGF